MEECLATHGLSEKFAKIVEGNGDGVFNYLKILRKAFGRGLVSAISEICYTNRC